MQSIIDWFDPYNIDHLRAFKALDRDGKPWPEGFLPEGIKFPTSWATSLMRKMTDAWIDTMLSKSSDRAKPVECEEHSDNTERSAKGSPTMDPWLDAMLEEQKKKRDREEN